MEALEFWFSGRYQSIRHLGCVDQSVCLSPCHTLSVHHFLEEYSVNNTALLPSCVCQALLSISIGGNPFNATSMVDLWMVGEWARGVQLPHHKNQFQNSVPMEA